jgi:cyclopropane fatty-acyl-phospholipid synthase-like methyltransferase
MNIKKRKYESLYSQVKEESQLNWYREDIPVYLKRAVELLKGRGKALDIGCGTGVCAVYMAQMGLQVTAIEFTSQALDLAKIKANKAFVNINFLLADVLEWQTSEKFDLIFDRGCLHSLKRKDSAKYKEQVLRWMVDNCEYILLHFGKKHYFNIRIGEPVRKTSEQIEELLSPELTLKEFFPETTKKGPLINYWFYRNKRT